MLPALLLGAAPGQAGTVYPANVKEASAILEDIRQEALEVGNLAASLQLDTSKGQADWDLHVATLADIRFDINDIGIKLVHLEAILGAAMPWQREAYQRALSMARVMGRITSSAMEDFLSTSEDQRYSLEYKSCQAGLGEESKHLGDLLHEYALVASANRKTGTQTAKTPSNSKRTRRTPTQQNGPSPRIPAE
jgi:hypothetical protein